MAETKQNLPFRPLEVRGHGVWDPERKAFYPFLVSQNTVVAKQGIRYFVHSVQLTVQKSGINAGSVGYLNVTVNGVTAAVAYAATPAMTQETDYFAVTVTTNPDVLCDVNTAIAEGSGGASFFVYAQIPDDISGQ